MKRKQKLLWRGLLRWGIKNGKLNANTYPGKDRYIPGSRHFQYGDTWWRGCEYHIDCFQRRLCKLSCSCSTAACLASFYPCHINRVASLKQSGAGVKVARVSRKGNGYMRSDTQENIQALIQLKTTDSIRVKKYTRGITCWLNSSNCPVAEWRYIIRRTGW